MQGRDANRNLQRSLKAGKVRERLPSTVQQLAGAVTQWQAEHGSAFMYDGGPLQVLRLSVPRHMQAPISLQWHVREDTFEPERAGCQSRDCLSVQAVSRLPCTTAVLTESRVCSC